MDPAVSFGSFEEEGYARGFLRIAGLGPPTLAKAACDELMTELQTKYSQYRFDSHKGYACPAHPEARRRFGPSTVQRRSFGSVQELPHGDFVDPIHFVFSKGRL